MILLVHSHVQEFRSRHALRDHGHSCQDNVLTTVLAKEMRMGSGEFSDRVKESASWMNEEMNIANPNYYTSSACSLAAWGPH